MTIGGASVWLQDGETVRTVTLTETSNRATVLDPPLFVNPSSSLDDNVVEADASVQEVTVSPATACAVGGNGAITLQPGASCDVRVTLGYGDGPGSYNGTLRFARRAGSRRTCRSRSRSAVRS